jgi:putative heme iron utilization protein
VRATNVATLATHSDDGHPWASLIAYGSLVDGAPVLFVSRLAEHARNLERDPRASLVVADAHPGSDVLASGRVTLAGVAERPDATVAGAAADAYVAAVPSAKAYSDFRDFSLWVLRVERVRWVGGYGRMDSTDGTAYAAAEPDPTGPAAARAIAHLNDDHADALLEIARALGGHPDATAAGCSGIDRYGMDLDVETPRGRAEARVAFAERVDAPDGLRAATVELAQRSRAS